MAHRLLIGIRHHIELIYLIFLGLASTVLIAYHYMRGTLTEWLDAKLDG